VGRAGRLMSREITKTIAEDTLDAL
jgi:hypothetical protein